MPSKFDIHFFKTANGREPVQEFLKHLIHSKNSTDKALADEILTYLMLLSEKGTTLGMPYSKHLRDSLWELRLKNNRIIYCCIQGNNIYLLHHFQKQSQKTPLKELKLAIRRYKELISR